MKCPECGRELDYVVVETAHTDYTYTLHRVTEADESGLLVDLEAEKELEDWGRDSEKLRMALGEYQPTPINAVYCPYCNTRLKIEAEWDLTPRRKRVSA